jgi:hypothetical protein
MVPYTPGRHGVEVEVLLHPVSTLAPNGDSGRHVPAALTPGRTPVLITGEAGWDLEPVWTCLEMKKSPVEEPLLNRLH